MTLYGARALVDCGGEIRMRIVFADGPRDTDDMRPAFRAPIEAFGGAICSPIEITPHGYGYPMNTDVFVIKRRFNGTRESYISRFVDPSRQGR